jgi:hypothetical protein
MYLKTGAAYPSMSENVALEAGAAYPTAHFKTQQCSIILPLAGIMILRDRTGRAAVPMHARFVRGVREGCYWGLVVGVGLSVVPTFAGIAMVEDWVKWMMVGS